MTIKSLSVLTRAAFAALLFVSVAGSAYAAMAPVPVGNPSLAAQNAVFQGN